MKVKGFVQIAFDTEAQGPANQPQKNKSRDSSLFALG